MLNTIVAVRKMFGQEFTVSRLLHYAGGVSNAILGLVYPSTCIGCGRRIPADGDPVCVVCTTHFERPDPEMLVERIESLTQTRCEVDSVFALWVFDKGGSLQKVQHALKYKNMPSMGHSLGRMMGQGYRNHLQSLPAILHPEVVVPIPLSQVRFYERGYNQAAVLAEGLAASLSIEIDSDALQRNRVTRSQTSLRQEQRWKNVCGAFSVQRPGTFINRNVLLIDDVLTTGATLVAAAETIRADGPASMHIAALCYARS